MHKPYEEITRHQPDFRIMYRFYSVEEGGRKIIPYQGIRSDFFYDHPDHNEKVNWIFMIWPEFENENGQIILDNTKSVPSSGSARMWLISKGNRDYHCGRIKVGTKGHFHEGRKKTGECTVIEILGLCTNPKT